MGPWATTEGLTAASSTHQPAGLLMLFNKTLVEAPFQAFLSDLPSFAF
jgi:hypothetical protein